MALRVAVIVPARDEARHIRACVRSIREQELDGELEVIVADGCSTDGTGDLAREAGATVVENARRITPAGLNVALAHARADVVLRFDAHSRMPPGYVQTCLRALEQEERNGAVNVGGWLVVQTATHWERAIAAALRSRFGIGNPRLWRRPERGESRRDVESVPFGCWRTETLRALGGWNESFVRNQDYELNHRLRSAGGRVVFDPAIWSIYVPRASLPSLARQFWDYGRFKARMLRTTPTSLQPRQLAPLALLAALVSAAVPGPLARWARSLLAAYAVVLTGVAAHSRGGWRTVPVIGTMHLAWGSGLVFGLATGARHEQAERRGSG